jgi:uncharacterized metal-binding protein
VKALQPQGKDTSRVLAVDPCYEYCCKGLLYMQDYAHDSLAGLLLLNEMTDSI